MVKKISPRAGIELGLILLMVMYQINFKEIHSFKLVVHIQKMQFFTYIRGHNSWQNLCITSFFELNLYFVNGQVPNEFQQNHKVSY